MIFSYITGLLSFLIMFLFIIFSNDYIPETRTSLLYFLESIFPTMFPFYVLSSIIVATPAANKLFDKLKRFARFYRLPAESLSAIFVGMLCGFPLGAKITSELYENNMISKKEAEIIAAFTNIAGPIYTINIIGNIYLDSKYYGIIIWLCLIISSLLTGLIFTRLYLKKEEEFSKKNIINKRNTDIANCIMTGLNTALYVGAVIVFFSSVLSVLKRIPFASSTAYTVIYSVTELTGGLKALIELFKSIQIEEKLKIIITTAIASWSGICVHLQVCGILRSAGINIKYYITGKLLCTLIAVILSTLIFCIII